MSVRTVVRKDFLDARRARIIWFVGVHYTLLVGLFFLHVRLGNAQGPAGPLTALWNMVFVGAVFVPAIALVAAYLAVAGERESGSIKQLLSTPISRRDVVLGKYVSRASLVAVSLVAGFLAAAGLSILWFGSVQPTAFAHVTALTALYALAYVAVAIGISAATDTRSRAMAGALGFYFMTNLVTLNDDISGLAGIEYVLNDVLDLSVGTSAIEFLGMVTNPTRAYLVATVGAFPDTMVSSVDIPTSSELAWYVQPEAAIAVLFAWLILPVAFGIWRFDRADIG